MKKRSLFKIVLDRIETSRQFPGKVILGHLTQTTTETQKEGEESFENELFLSFFPFFSSDGALGHPMNLNFDQKLDCFFD